MKIRCQILVLTIILTATSQSVSAGKCKVCDSTNPDCLKSPEKIEDKDCTTECYTLLEENGNIKRGCVDDNNKCDSKNCTTCDVGDKSCNIQTFWCNNCDSSTDDNCATWKDEKSIQIGFCQPGITKCLMRIEDNKHTIRRCAQKDEVCQDGKKCNICDQNSCNKGIYPSNRRKCYQCDSTDAKCATPTKYATDIVSSVCLLFDDSGKCFEHGSSEAMSRGCSSDAPAYAKCTSENPKDKCRECDSDGCNVREYKYDPTTKCIQCKSDDSKCAWGYKAEDAAVCSNKLEYWKQEACYTHKIDAGKVDRGCIQDFDCAGAGSSCTSCTSGNACNNADANEFTCYKCRSDEVDKCKSKLEGESYKPAKCRNPVSEADVGCYTELWDGIVIRSCLVDADPKTRENCLDKNSKTCKSCKEANCNKDDAPASAHGLAMQSGLLVIGLLVLRFF